MAKRLFARATPVFAAEQVDGYQASVSAALAATVITPIEQAEAFVAATGASIHHGGSRAFYRPSSDSIQLPPREAFIKCANAVYADYLYQLAAYGLLWSENYPDHPLVGGFHLCRFAKEQGDFSHHYFPSLDDEAETFLRMRDLFDRVKKAERRLR